MAKLTINNIVAGFRSITGLNSNFDAIETALENTLSRDGTAPNAMGANLDMNSNRIINLAQGVNPSDAVTKAQAEAIAATIPIGPQGPQGEKGDKGDQGDTGATGSPGDPSTLITTGSFTTSFTGFVSPGTYTIYWTKVGRTITLWSQGPIGGGDSNSSAFITSGGPVPADLRPPSLYYGIGIGSGQLDNTATVWTDVPIITSVSPAGNINFRPVFADDSAIPNLAIGRAQPSTWNSSGEKSVYSFTITYPSAT